MASVDEVQTAPIESSLIPQTHPAMYLMHKYWARKPHNIVREYVRHYSRPGDVVLDPFCGSGVTVVESLRVGRKAIGFDLNPIATHIAESTLIPVSPYALDEEFAELERDMKPRINESFYRIRCLNCGHSAHITHIVWSRLGDCPRCGTQAILANLRKKGQRYRCDQCGEWFTEKPVKRAPEEPLEVWWECYSCGTGRKPRRSRVTVAQAPSLRTEILAGEQLPVPPDFPSPHLYENARILVRPGMRLSDFFTGKARCALMMLHRRIQSVRDPSVRKILLFTFTSALAQTSRLIAYRGGFKTGGSAWTVPGFWFPAHHVEINVWNAYEARFKKIRRGKQEAAKTLADGVRFASTIGDLQDGGTVLLQTRDSRDLGILPDESVDYILTDPPFGDSVPYFEYCAFWAPWLGEEIAFDGEIVISNSSARKKDIDDYGSSLREVFKECLRVLKVGSWMSLMFNNRDLLVWKSLVDAVLAAGFDYVNDVYQVPAVISSKAQLAQHGSMTGELIINFRKQESTAAVREPPPAEEVERLIICEAAKIIVERGELATSEQLHRGILHQLIARQSMGSLDNSIEALLRGHFRKVGRNHWGLGPRSPRPAVAPRPLKDELQSVIREALSEGPTTEQVIARVLSVMTNGRTPDWRDILEALEELGTRAGRRWVLRKGRQLRLCLDAVAEKS